MAMNENKSYCPCDMFDLRATQYDYVSPHWKETQQLLGDRIKYMSYERSGKPCGEEYYIVDALVAAKGTLGIQVAAALKQLIPTCVYAETGCPIVCTDIINPDQILSKGKMVSGRWTYIGNERKTCSGQVAMSLYEDERYMIVIQEGEGEVQIFLYRK